MSFQTYEKIQIIYNIVKHPVDGKIPYGIRDSGGFLFFFPKITYYQGQEERFEDELFELHELANYLHDSLLKQKKEEK